MNPDLHPALGHNLLLRTDSYKTSHWLQYPPGTQHTFSYIESRGGRYGHSLFFGLQAYLREYLTRPVTDAHIAEAKEVLAAHGLPFNEAGWKRLVEKHGGYLPLRIRAVAEGSVLPVHHVLVTVENTDPEFFWLPSYIETELLRAVWYPTTVATQSASAKAVIAHYLHTTSDRAAQELPFKLHDFGARGVSSLESAALGGLAHLLNFQGTDTLTALLAGRRYYDCAMAGFSIPAAEHSTITAWGREHEAEAYRNMLRQFAKPGSILAVVSDSYDIFHACDVIWGQQLRDAVVASGATVVIRPDSGDPVATVLQVARILADRFGTTTNSRGYRVLQHVRIIQGDGINLGKLREILQVLQQAGFSAENVAFGMGGGLLQQLNRDTMKFAMKCSAVQVDGQWREVYKDPVGDHSKASKRGRITLAQRPDGSVQTVRESELPPDAKDLLRPVFENGQILVQDTLDTVRLRAEEGFMHLKPDDMPAA
ncbi:MAG: nicotinate phosphoribosyltransferase [Brachymonas sp.]|nr:nicotinate phosphoribosyltransferase [Brachymonas sp.]